MVGWDALMLYPIRCQVLNKAAMELWTTIGMDNRWLTKTIHHFHMENPCHPIAGGVQGVRLDPLTERVDYH